MSLGHAILGILEFQPMHGYELKRVLAEGISLFWPVNLPAIYPSLKRLEQEGLVAHRTEPTPEGRPDRKVFTITDAGRTELARWRRLPPDGEQRLRSPLFLKLLFAKDENLRDAVEWIDKELEHARALGDQVRAELADPRALSTFFVQFMRESAVAHLAVQIELLEGLRERVQARIADLARSPSVTKTEV
jgi:DNA-binding PadR family transcriptional regulator